MSDPHQHCADEIGQLDQDNTRLEGALAEAKKVSEGWRKAAADYKHTCDVYLGKLGKAIGARDEADREASTRFHERNTARSERDEIETKLAAERGLRERAEGRSDHFQKLGHDLGVHRDTIRRCVQTTLDGMHRMISTRKHERDPKVSFGVVGKWISELTPLTKTGVTGLLTERIRLLMTIGQKAMGNYKDALFYIEEHLAQDEYDQIKGFFGWLKKNKLTAGRGNVDQRWKEWQATL